jgi:hypothetical protein
VVFVGILELGVLSLEGIVNQLAMAFVHNPWVGFRDNPALNFGFHHDAAAAAAAAANQVLVSPLRLFCP